MSTNNIGIFTEEIIVNGSNTKTKDGEEVRVVGYTRYSSDNQSENSTYYQSNAIKSYCKAKGYRIIRMYSDKAKTGTNGNRTEFQKMLNAAGNNPPWTKIIVFSYSRYFRNTAGATTIEAKLNSLGIELVSITQNFDNTPEGRLMKRFTYTMDEYYSDCVSLHTHSGMSGKAEQCFHCGGIPPLGYTVNEDKKLVICEEEADIVREIFDMYEQEYSYKKMAEVLNAKGYKTKAGKPFTKHSFSAILTQEKYTGVFVWNRTKRKDENGRRNSHRFKPLDEYIRVENGCPAIISPEQFDKVRQKMTSRVQGTATSKSRQNYMLSGLKLMKCAECGAYMVGNTVRSHGRKYTVYSCPNHKDKGCPVKDIKTEQIDKLVAGMLVQDLFNRQDIEDIERLMSSDNEINAMKMKLSGLERAKINVVTAIKNCYVEELTEELEKIKSEEKELRKKIDKIENKKTILKGDAFRKICKRFGRLLVTSNDITIKNYLKKCIEEILVDNEGVQLTFCEA